jgi:hypothetical protein
MDARRIETTRGMIGDLIAKGEWIREQALCKGDHGRGKCQEFQLIRVFGIHKFERDRLVVHGDVPYAEK